MRIVSQRTIAAVSPKHRGIRMDVEVEELGDVSEDGSVYNVYDVEPTHIESKVLPKRNRFYQAKIDSRYMKSGEQEFAKLPGLYVVNILDYDPFGYDQMVYTVHNACVEVPELKYADGLQFLYFYTNGSKGGTEAIRKMLNYIKDSRESNVTDEATRELHEYVTRVRVQPEVRLEYMKFDEIIAYHRNDARKEFILECLEELGEVPERLCECIEQENEKEVLVGWQKLAAKVTSIEEFEQRIKVTV